MIKTYSIKPMFSIIIPTYNRAERLKIALESILKQTFQNFEVLVCDDGSTDHTKDVVQLFINKLDLTYIWEENWGGPARPRNNGIKKAKGEWVCFLDSDDWWYSNKLEKLNEHISSHTEADFVCHELIMNNVLTGYQRVYKCGPIVPNLYYNMLMYGNNFLNSGTSIKKSTLTKFNIEISESKDFISVEDFDLCLQLASYGAIFSCIHIPLGEYIVESQNISNSPIHSKNLKSLLKYHIFEKQTFEPNKVRLWKEVSCILDIYQGNFCFKNGDYFRFIQYYTSAIKNSQKSFIKYIYNRISKKTIAI
jgi:glycosyltransferase involved in cell wall biosynthesis